MRWSKGHLKAHISKIPTESMEAISLMSWVMSEGILEWPELILLSHIPNGGWRHKVGAARLKAEGVHPGAFDYRLPVARCGYHGLELELKRIKGPGLSPAQITWSESLTAQGYLCLMARGWEDASSNLLDYLRGLYFNRSQSLTSISVSRYSNPEFHEGI